MSKETLTAERDAYNIPYPPEELYARKVMHETAHLEPPKVFEERARRYLEAEKLGIKLSAMQIAWAEKVLKI